MEEKFFIGILSHKGSKKREHQKSILDSYNDPNIIFYYFVGDPNLDDEYSVDEINKVVTLRVPDNYESLAKKTGAMIKFYSENYAEKTKGILKTDDDIEINPSLIYKMLKENSEIEYFGNLVNIETSYNSTWHWGKCESTEWNQTILKVPVCKYCSGGGYYLKNSVALKMKGNIQKYSDFVFEDVATGYILNSIGIYPVDGDIKNNGLNW